MPDLSPYEVRTPDPNPDPTPGSILARVYVARPKAFYLQNMIATLVARGQGIFSFVPGGLLHRLFDTVAVEMTRLDKYFETSLNRAIRNSVYEAFNDPPNFTPRLAAAYAGGLQSFTRLGGPALIPELIPAGTIVVARDGRTLVTTEDVTLDAGRSTTYIRIRSETPGVSGNVGPGEAATIVSPLPSSYATTNPGPIDGGRESESDASVLARWQIYILSRASAYPAAIVSIAMGVQVRTPDGAVYRAQSLALVQPWRVPDLNLPGGAYYMVVDAGGATAPPELVAEIQRAISPKTSAGNQGYVLACVPAAAQLSVTYAYRSKADPGVIERAITAAWGDYFSNSELEDGSGIGEVDLDALPNTLLGSHNAIVRLNVDLAAAVKPPVGARAVAGAITFIRTAI